MSAAAPSSPALLVVIRLAAIPAEPPLDGPGEVSWVDLDGSADGVRGAVPLVARLDEAMVGACLQGSDVIILNDDQPLLADQIAAMRSVAGTDPMIGFVVPSGYKDGQTSLHPGNDSHATWPPYAPSSAGSRVYVRSLMIEEFGGLEREAGDVMAAVTDLMARANRCGYRAAAAAIGGLTAAALGAESAARQPEVARAEVRRTASPEAIAERLMLGLRPTLEGRLRVAFDCTVLSNHHAGTSETIRHLVTSAAATWTDRCELFVICSQDVFCFHRFDAVAGVRWAPPDRFDPPYAAVIRIGQLFSREALAQLRLRAPVEILTMLDTIALDCAYLDGPDLQRLWQDSADAADALVFISEFSRQQFGRRFRTDADTIAATSLLSLDPADYGHPPALAGEGSAAGHLLVVGNQFEHKAVRQTALALAARTPPESIMLLGHPSIEGGARIQGYLSGQLDESFVDQLYAGARCIIYPSHYEGFGLPIMHALARRKPVIARDLPPFREIVATTGLGLNVHLVATTREMVSLATSPDLGWKNETVRDLAHLGWLRCAADYRNVLEAAWERLDVSRLASRVAVAQAASRELAAEVEVSKLRAELREATARTGAIAEDLARIRAREDVLSADLADSQLRAAALQSEFEAASAGYIAAEAHFDATEAKFIVAEAEFIAAETHFLADRHAATEAIVQLRARQALLETELASLTASRAALLGSTSWRVTAPLRKLASAVKALGV